MAEERTQKQQAQKGADLDPEKTPAGDEETRAPESDQEKAPSGGAKGKGRRILAGIRMHRRWGYAAACALVLVLAGWGVLKGVDRAKGPEIKWAGLSRGQAQQDRLRQEAWPRFYIPLRQDLENRVLAVELAVVWDALSAVRFQKMEIPLRDRLYAFLQGLGAKGDGIGNEAPFLEAEMGRILREALRTENLTVKVREIKIF